MRSVLIANAKGGVGKTTAAITIAAALARQGARVGLADADRQRSALRWLRVRPDTAAAIATLDWSRGKDVDAVPGPLDWLVIDAPGALKGSRIEGLAASADAVVVPVTASMFDMRATAKFLETLDAVRRVRKGRAAVLLLANRVRRGRAQAALEAFLAARDRAPVARVGDRAAYVELAGVGLSVFDRDIRALAPLRGEWAPLLAALG